MAEESGAQPSHAVWQRNEMRTTMLATARKIIERDGIAELSLNAVAEEAALAPVAVYACFPSKADLLGSLLSDDLAQLARTMQNRFPFSPPPEPRQPPDDPTQTVQFQSEVVVPFPDGAAENSAENESNDAAAARKARRARLRQALNKDSEHPAAPNNPDEAELTTPVRVDAWLERRLRVFERGLAEIDARLAEAERTSQRAVGFAEDTTRFLAEHTQSVAARERESQAGLDLRIDAAEKRQREMLAEFRAEVKESACRIEAVEAAIATSRSEIAPAPMPEWTPPNYRTAPAEAALQPDAANDAAQQEEAAGQSEATETYLTAARRAAKAAATLARIDDDVQTETRAKLTRYLLIGGGALLVLLVVVGLVMRGLDGRPSHSTALPHAAVMRTSGTTHKRIVTAGPTFSSLLALANAGNAKAQVLVGLDYLNGNGAAKNDVQAALMLRRAANAGNAVGQFWLATLYSAGEGVAKDPQAALHWYEASAMQGNRKAMHALGMAYATGAGADKNSSEAARWFSQAAAQGLVNSQFNLAVLYERGLGLPQSLVDAYKWYAIAAGEHDAESAARIDALATQLSPADLAAAKQAAANFRPAPLNPATNLIPQPSDFAGH